MMTAGALRSRSLLAVGWLTVGITSSCATVRTPANSHGVVGCPAGAANAPLSVDALQCWFVARHGQWRTLSHESHYDVLVARVEALDLRDADEIAQRFVASERRTFSEILVYVQSEPRAGSTRVRRIRWTKEAGTETIDFVAPIA